MKREAEILRLDIVLVGDFNPKIFNPAWFSAHDLIGEVEADDANIEVIHSDVSVFNLDWFRLQVTRDRFSIFTEQEAYFRKLIDFVIQTFYLLEHTPATAIGANWGGHYKTDSINEWHDFGHFIAPQSPWLNVFEDPAVLKIEMAEKAPELYSPKGNIQIRVTSSSKVKHGIFINLNDHYEVGQDNRKLGCKEIIKLFEENRDESQNKFDNAVTMLFANFERREN